MPPEERYSFPYFLGDAFKTIVMTVEVCIIVLAAGTPERGARAPSAFQLGEQGEQKRTFLK